MLGTPCPTGKGSSSLCGSSECIILNSVWIATSPDEKDCFGYLPPRNSNELTVRWNSRND